MEEKTLQLAKTLAQHSLEDKEDYCMSDGSPEPLKKKTLAAKLENKIQGFRSVHSCIVKKIHFSHKMSRFDLGERTFVRLFFAISL